MTALERIEAHLRKHEGLFLCASCLGHEIGVAAPEARSIVWTFQALQGFDPSTLLRGYQFVDYGDG
jgi:hypothetical protein